MLCFMSYSKQENVLFFFFFNSVVCLTAMFRCYSRIRFVMEPHDLWLLNEQTDCVCFCSVDNRESGASNAACSFGFHQDNNANLISEF